MFLEGTFCLYTPPYKRYDDDLVSFLACILSFVLTCSWGEDPTEFELDQQQIVMGDLLDAITAWVFWTSSNTDSSWLNLSSTMRSRALLGPNDGFVGPQQGPKFDLEIVISLCRVSPTVV